LIERALETGAILVFGLRLFKGITAQKRGQLRKLCTSPAAGIRADEKADDIRGHLRRFLGSEKIFALPKIRSRRDECADPPERAHVRAQRTRTGGMELALKGRASRLIFGEDH